MYTTTAGGKHYNYFRDYDPSIGRYFQSDPIGLEGGMNAFTYVNANPLAFIDSLGLALSCKPPPDPCPPPKMKEYAKCIQDCFDKNVKDAMKCSKVLGFRAICLAGFAAERVICTIKCSVNYPDCWRKTLD